uniref:PIN2 (TERF1) interacting telomerase inhibitor 1 n=1 Tax=Lepisosteus oculatus TaxID=7918 RepID=W5NJA7_LEPOC|nr:PREDICTED: PIN2/TERF1-interacting telomerase inhibitor 1 [Lepisosteus oculatus]
MAMLAEPRRKQKWSVDPRNSAWSNDESKFGQKMLEKMGWSKGKGLGRCEQGATEHVKVKVKNNSLGLGSSASYEDNWIAHQDDFNKLLADLNTCHAQNGSTDSEQKQSFSLEEKSKTSKKRVHYMKFTKGKDLSSRSESDLACIFGKRIKKSKEQEEGSSSQESQEETEQEDGDAKQAVTSGLDVETPMNTVTSSLTMQEYFAQRMARLKKSQGEAQTESAIVPSSEDSGPPESPKQKSKKKKKKHGRRESAELLREAVTGDGKGSPEGEELEKQGEKCVDTVGHTVRKPKKSKNKEVVKGHVQGEEEDNATEKIERKKQKRKKKEEEPEEITVKPKKNKKKKRDHLD